jgi:hypothetical protein
MLINDNTQIKSITFTINDFLNDNQKNIISSYKTSILPLEELITFNQKLEIAKNDLEHFQDYFNTFLSGDIN